ncbi:MULTISPECIES: hypothetical protein [Gordonia]|uniref:hypothetical protein n=1 Tax=Gordonia TaxID=2053 RepID=UPI0004196384|nr:MULTISPECIES: hypothetical protein [Gordonia]ATD71865.1 hypothetical protein CNO18_17975 [Gordonia sp. 1D]MCZ4578009.1 hypothetical protein [Gordonia amicalis]MDJ0451581.1 hypothetical protein [Gordonia amicalis]MDV7075738.1 hypothetical protein [Gordonia amicalis]UKO91460.1 hypothetical protein IHQ52_21235 [Gordonia amicalis]
MPNDPQQPDEQQQPDEPTTPPTPQPDDQPQPNEAQQPDEPTENEPTPEPEPDTFPRAYVEDLRKENADYRTRAKAADDLAKRLHTELVRATGKLADPTDMPFDPEHLDDPDKLAVSIDQLLSAKPHLKARRVVGAVGQGESGTTTGVDLLGIMRGTA